jgi:hypothetical protein
MLGSQSVDVLRRRTASLPRLLDQLITTGSLDNARDEVRFAEHRHALREVLADYAAGPHGREEVTRASV